MASYTYKRTSVTTIRDNYCKTSYSYDKNNRLINTVRNEEDDSYITDYSHDKSGNQLTKVKNESNPDPAKGQSPGIKIVSELSGNQMSWYCMGNTIKYKDINKKVHLSMP
mgnify:CR=1 FL=1